MCNKRTRARLPFRNSVLRKFPERQNKKFNAETFSMSDPSKITPTDEDVIQAILHIHKQNPEWGNTKIAIGIRTNNPQWVVSEKRIKKILQVTKTFHSKSYTLIEMRVRGIEQCHCLVGRRRYTNRPRRLYSLFYQRVGRPKT
jgi:hypothetical protein